MQRTQIYLADAEQDGLPRDAAVSVITVGELFAGAREGDERTALDAMLSTFHVLPLDGDIAAQGGLLWRDCGKSHGVGLNDALIGATALLHGRRFATLNGKHYPMLPGKELIQPYLKH
jgi:predicted nucleic acid-binding protein